MLDKDMLDAITTPKMINKGELIKKLIQQITNHSDMLQNALENDKTLIVGREASHIEEKARTVLQLLNS